MEVRFCVLGEGIFLGWSFQWEVYRFSNGGNLLMFIITKAVISLRMFKYRILKITWYRKSVIRQLRSMLAISKKDRNIGQGKRYRGQSRGIQWNLIIVGFCFIFIIFKQGVFYYFFCVQYIFLFLEKGLGRNLGGRWGRF